MKQITHTHMKLITGLILLSFALFSTNTLAVERIGRVIHSIGDVQAANNGKTRALKRGSSIYEGDVVRSSRDSLSQLRMSDGALIALRANTQLRFDEYRYKKDQKGASSSVFSLLKGGFRTISGLIGKVNKQNYRVRTSVATIGIRGTHYGLTLCENNECSNNVDGNIQDGLYGSVVDGEIHAENGAGATNFSNDQYFHIAGMQSQPRKLIRPPSMIFEQVKITKKLRKMQQEKTKLAALMQQRQLEIATVLKERIEAELPFGPQPKSFVSADDPDNNLFLIPTPPNSGMLYSFNRGSLAGGTLEPLTSALINDGNLNNFVINGNVAALGLFLPVATSQDVGSAVPIERNLFIAGAPASNLGAIQLGDARVGWGRWGAQYALAENGNLIAHQAPLHYVVSDNLTKQTQLANLSGTANYRTVGGTLATDLKGNTAANIATVISNVTFNFTTSTIDSYYVNTKVGGFEYEAKLANAAPIAFTNDTLLTLGGDVNCTACSGQASISFAGSQAQGAMTSYVINNNSSIDPNTVNGVAALAETTGGVTAF